MSNYLTKEEAIEAEKVRAKEEVCVDFDGQNCPEERNCLGWDGEDDRCDCGNRRVYWNAYKMDSGFWYAYAAAY